MRVQYGVVERQPLDWLCETKGIVKARFVINPEEIEEKERRKTSRVKKSAKPPTLCRVLSTESDSCGLSVLRGVQRSRSGVKTGFKNKKRLY